MNFIADMHCHTVASGHAYSTIEEYARAAKDKGIELIAVTDHGIEMPGAPHLWHFWNLRVVPEEINGVTILKGVEANIMDLDGNIDMPNDVLERLDIIIASFHYPCFQSGSVKENTVAAINALKNPFVDILGHPDDPNFLVDIDEVVAAAKEYGKLIELNNRSSMVRIGSDLYTIEFARKAKEYNTMAVCSSDAHISFELGEFDVVKQIVDDVQLPEELILNTSKGKILNFINNRRNRE